MSAATLFWAALAWVAAGKLTADFAYHGTRVRWPAETWCRMVLLWPVFWALWAFACLPIGLRGRR